MKKQIVLIFILMGLLMPYACEKNESVEDSKSFSDDLLSQFISSNDINQLFKQNTSFSEIGDISIEESTIENIIVDNEEHYVISVAICKKNKITGQIVAIKLPDTSKKLNTNHSYVMALRDFREFNFKTNTGIVRDYDLNYDGYNCGYIIVENNYIQNIATLTMPYHIQNKYSFKRASNYKSHPCDLSGEGDISFGECYSCLKAAIASHGDTEFLCDALNILGVCNLSVAVSCIIISSRE